jgi:hypothetical protein
VHDEVQCESHDDECMICLGPGELLMCEFEKCRNAAHMACVGLKKMPSDNEPWLCPIHATGAAKIARETRLCDRPTAPPSLCLDCHSVSATCKCPCVECGRAQGSRIRCNHCNRLFHQ